MIGAAGRVVPYAAFRADCDVVTAPTEADLARVAAEGQRPGLIIFTYPFESMAKLLAAHVGKWDELSGQPYQPS